MSRACSLIVAAIAVILPFAAVEVAAQEVDAFYVSEWADLSPPAGWTLLAGQVTGDARRDIVAYQPSLRGDRSRGSVWVGENTGESFDLSLWNIVTPAEGWVFMLGNFSGNNDRADLFAYHPSNGSLRVGNNTGSRFASRVWGTVTPHAGWTFLVGQFAGDERDDLLGYHPSNGSLWVFTNEGDRFSRSLWKTVTPHDGWTFLTGQFTDGNRLDIVGYHPSDRGDRTHGSLWVGENTGTRFAFSEYARGLSPANGWTWFAGRFAGTGLADVVGYQRSDHGNLDRHSLWVGINKGDRFDFEQWSSFWASTWSFLTGQFAADSLLDLVGYDPVHRVLWVWSNTGTSFAFDTWADEAALGETAEWTFLAGAFAGDSQHDVVGYDGGTGRVIVGNNCHPFEGYAWPLSATAGELIDFMVSGRGDKEVVFVRHEVEANEDGTVLVDEVVSRARFSPSVQPLSQVPWRNGAGWTPTFTLTIPRKWPSGIYSARVTDSLASRYIPFIVKPARRRSDVALLANVNTWLAYNNWGGGGKYGGEELVSFLRPNPRALPDATGFHPEHLTRGELKILTWLLREEYAPDVYTDIDFHKGEVHQAGYHTLIVGTHPEYWTEEMYDNLKAFLEAGGSLVYLGGNGIFEKGRYYEDGTGMEFQMSDEGDRLRSELFRADWARPERALLGVMTGRCGVFAGPYMVEPGMSTDLLLADTWLTEGDLFGATGASANHYYTAASGLEIDVARPFGFPIGCGTYLGPNADWPRSDPPAELRILARGQNYTEGEDGALVQIEGATMATYDHPGGGLVFSAGSISFGSSLMVDPALQQIVRNVLAEAARRAAR